MSILKLMFKSVKKDNKITEFLGPTNHVVSAPAPRWNQDSVLWCPELLATSLVHRCTCHSFLQECRDSVMVQAQPATTWSSMGFHLSAFSPSWGKSQTVLPFLGDLKKLEPVFWFTDSRECQLLGEAKELLLPPLVATGATALPDFRRKQILLL